MKRYLATYLITLLPTNYLMAGLTTPAQLINPTQIARTALAGGPINILTAGISTPLVNGIRQGFGSALSHTGDLIGLPSITASGERMKSKASEWFNGGYGEAIGKNIPRITVSPAGQPADSNPSDQQSIYNAHPDYYSVDGPANVQYSPTPGEYHYSDLDALGRTGIVYASIDYAHVRESAGWRSKFEPDSDPAGWGSNSKVSIPNVNGKAYKGYLYNRSHLIADSLGGRSYRNNLITGTRGQNVGVGSGGMQYIEKKVVDFVNANQNCPVYYAVTPNYMNETDLVPSTVSVDAKSCDGQINEHVTTYNVANGYTIHYNDGSYSKN